MTDPRPFPASSRRSRRTASVGRTAWFVGGSVVVILTIGAVLLVRGSGASDPGEVDQGHGGDDARSAETAAAGVHGGPSGADRAAGVDESHTADEAPAAAGDDAAEDPRSESTPNAEDAAGASDVVADVGAGEDTPRLDLGVALDVGAPTPPPGEPVPMVVDGSRAAEGEMSAAALLEAARAAYAEHNYKEAYRLATKSVYQEPTNEGRVLKGKAACGLRDGDLAKAVMKAFKLTDPNRKAIREDCQDKGVRVGL